MKVATNEEHFTMCESLPGLNELFRRKIPVSKVMICFRNNIAPSLANKKCFRSELRCIFESHWVNEFFNTIVYFKSNRAEETEINCIL